MAMLPAIRAFIVEDVPANRSSLLRILADYCPLVTVVGESECVEESFRLIQELKPDLIFLDIGLRNGTGFDLLALLQQAGQLTAKVIFLTGENRYDYATRAFGYSAIDFLNKPIDVEKLCRAVERVQEHLDSQQYKQQIDLLLDILQKPAAQLDGRLALHIPRGGLEVITIADIVRCEADGVVTHIIRTNAPKITAMRNLGHYRSLLVTDYNFFSIDHGELVNLDYVTRYNPQTRLVTLHDGSTRTASRRCGQELGQYLKQNPLPKASLIGEGFKKWLRKQLGTNV